MKKSLLLLAQFAARVSAAPQKRAQHATLTHISANSLRGHVSFFASDLLEGPDTASCGQDLAAEYLAARYRRAGLKPMGDDEYFQTAPWTHTLPDLGRLAFTLRAGRRVLALDSHPVGIHLASINIVNLTKNDVFVTFRA